MAKFLSTVSSSSGSTQPQSSSVSNKWLELIALEFFELEDKADNNIYDNAKVVKEKFDLIDWALAPAIGGAVFEVADAVDGIMEVFMCMGMFGSAMQLAQLTDDEQLVTVLDRKIAEKLRTEDEDKDEDDGGEEVDEAAKTAMVEDWLDKTG